MATRDLEVEVLQDPHDPGRPGGRAVAGDRHEVELERQGDLAGEVAHQDEGALQHADEEQVPVPVVVGDALGELPDLVLDHLLGEQDLRDFRWQLHGCGPPSACR